MTLRFPWPTSLPKAGIEFDAWFWFRDICLVVFHLPDTRLYSSTPKSFNYRIAHTVRLLLLWVAFMCAVTSVLFRNRNTHKTFIAYDSWVESSPFHWLRVVCKLIWQGTRPKVAYQTSSTMRWITSHWNILSANLCPVITLNDNFPTTSIRLG